jgi:hypothetical protein
MARAFPISHATTIASDGGPGAVLAHLPCPEGHYACKHSSVRCISVAQKALAQHLQRDLDRAREKNALLTQVLATMRP